MREALLRAGAEDEDFRARLQKRGEVGFGEGFEAARIPGLHSIRQHYDALLVAHAAYRDIVVAVGGDGCAPLGPEA